MKLLPLDKLIKFHNTITHEKTHLEVHENGTIELVARDYSNTYKNHQEFQSSMVNLYSRQLSTLLHYASDFKSLIDKEEIELLTNIADL